MASSKRKKPGTKRRSREGYVQVLVAGHWRREHRLVAERAMGRKLKASEVVHHLNEVKHDNRPGNLMVVTSHAAHRALHAGKAVAPVWDGRAAALPKPKGKPEGPAIAVRLGRQRLVKWRELQWFQGNLKTITPAALEKQKASIRKRGFVRPFFVWDEPGTANVWILDGHQMKRSLAELEAEGYALPDKLPAVPVLAASREDAHELVLTYSSHYGEVNRDGLVEFVEGSGLRLEGMLGELNLGSINLEAVHEEFFGAGDPLAKILDRETRDSRPGGPQFSLLTIRNPRLVPRVVAWLNREGIEHSVEEAANHG